MESVGVDRRRYKQMANELQRSQKGHNLAGFSNQQSSVDSCEYFQPLSTRLANLQNT